MRNATAMSFEQISRFLAAKGGLARVTDIDAVDRRPKGTAQLIADAAMRYSINPKYILALIQKESSAVESPGSWLRAPRSRTAILRREARSRCRRLLCPNRRRE